METVEDQFVCQEGPVKKALEKNSAMFKSPIRPVGRNKFFYRWYSSTTSQNNKRGII